MGISWAFLVLQAMLLAEVNVELMRRRALEEQLHSQVLSLRTMAEETIRGAAHHRDLPHAVLHAACGVHFEIRGGSVVASACSKPSCRSALHCRVGWAAGRWRGEDGGLREPSPHHHVAW